MTSSFPLWSDEPATQDLLAFQAVADTAADAIFDDGLDPVAIGLSGAWGSGKTSVLELIKSETTERSKGSDREVLVIPTQPWLYDPAVGPKDSLHWASWRCVVHTGRQGAEGPKARWRAA